MTKPYDPLAKTAEELKRPKNRETASFLEEGVAPQPGFVQAWPALEQSETFPLHYNAATRTAMPVRKRTVS